MANRCSSPLCLLFIVFDRQCSTFEISSGVSFPTNARARVGGRCRWQASPLQTIYTRETPKTTAIFTRFSPLGAPLVTCHEAWPLQTIYGRETPKTTAISPVFPPWNLHRLHVIRLHRCKPSTVGSKNHSYFHPFFPLGSPTGYMSSGLTVANHLWYGDAKNHSYFHPFFPLGSSTGYMSSGFTVANHLR